MVSLLEIIRNNMFAAVTFATVSPVLEPGNDCAPYLQSISCNKHPCTAQALVNMSCDHCLCTAEKARVALLSSHLYLHLLVICQFITNLRMAHCVLLSAVWVFLCVLYLLWPDVLHWPVPCPSGNWAAPTRPAVCPADVRLPDRHLHRSEQSASSR